MKNSEIVEYSKQIDLYLKGKLNRKAIDVLWISFLKNPVLYDYFETELHLKSLIQKSQKRKDLAEKIAAGRLKWRRRVVYFSVAAVMLYIAFIGFNQLFVQDSTTIDQIALSIIEPGEMVAGTILRSDENSAVLLEVELNRAIAEAFNQQYESSINRLNSLNHDLLTETQKIMVQLNLGILHFNNQEFGLAESYFQNVVDSGSVTATLEEQARWYLANSYLKSGRIDDARTEAAKVLLFEGKYQSKADEFLNKTKELNPM